MLGVDVVWMKYSVCLPKSCPFTSLRACSSMYFCVSDASLAAQAPLAFRFCDTIGHMFLCIFVCFCIFCVYLCVSVWMCVFSSANVMSDASLAAQAPLAFCFCDTIEHCLMFFCVFLCVSLCIFVCFCVFLCISVCFCVFLYASVYFPGSDCHVRYFSCRTSCTWILSQPDDALCAFCTSQIYQMWTQIYQPWTSHLSNSRFFLTL